MKKIKSVKEYLHNSKYSVLIRVGKTHLIGGGLCVHEFGFALQEISRDKIHMLRMEADRDIYYEDVLVVKAGGNVPFYTHIDNWDYKGEKPYVAVLDFRIPGKFGKDFDPSCLTQEFVVTARWD